MALTLALSVQERTWRLELFTEQGTDYKLIAHREKVGFDANGAIVFTDRNVPDVIRPLSKIAATPLNFAGVQITGAQLAIAISALVDQFREEDLASTQV